MKKTIGSLLWSIGLALDVAMVLAAFIYAQGRILWLHAPMFSVLLFTTLMTLPLFGLGWFLKRTGKRMELRSAPRRFKVPSPPPP